MNPIWEVIAGPVLKIIDKFVPDAAKKAELQLELAKLQYSQEGAELEANVKAAVGQLEVNKAEAANPSLFVSGWRPFVGWLCAGGIGFQVILAPLLEWGSALAGAPTQFPQLDTSTLTTMLLGMLGLGGMRTFEKIQGVARK